MLMSMTVNTPVIKVEVKSVQMVRMSGNFPRWCRTSALTAAERFPCC